LSVVVSKQSRRADSDAETYGWISEVGQSTQVSAFIGGRVSVAARRASLCTVSGRGVAEIADSAVFEAGPCEGGAEVATGTVLDAF
jgi:hypothetical protein